jgi:hypothetical protein
MIFREQAARPILSSWTQSTLTLATRARKSERTARAGLTFGIAVFSHGVLESGVSICKEAHDSSLTNEHGLRTLAFDVCFVLF